MDLNLMYSLIGLETSLTKRGESIHPWLVQLNEHHDPTLSSANPIYHYFFLFLNAIYFAKENVQNQEIIRFVIHRKKNANLALEDYLFIMYVLHSLVHIRETDSYSLLIEDDFYPFTKEEQDQYYRLLQLDFLSLSIDQIKEASSLEQALWILWKNKSFLNATFMAKDFSQEVMDLVSLLAPISYRKTLPKEVIMELDNHEQIIDDVISFQLQREHI